MQLTRAADYAVRAMIHLATLPTGSRVNIGELARASDAPTHFMSKVLQQLVHGGLVGSRRGENGGFELALPPEQISMLQVVEAIEGRLALNSCLTSDTACQRSEWCAAHKVWADAQSAMIQVLASASMAQLARDSAANRERLVPRICVLATEEAAWT